VRIRSHFYELVTDPSDGLDRLFAQLPAEIRDVLESPIPVSGLTLQVFGAPFKGSPPKASVLLGFELRGADLKLAAGDKLQVSYRAIDAKGKVQGGNNEMVTLNLRPETKAAIEKGGLRMLSRVELPPGRYQVRVGADELNTRLVGSVLYDLDVPDFVKPVLSMSGIVLTSATASAVPTFRQDEQMRQVLPAAPVVLREFPSNDEIALFAEVYDNAAGTPHKVDITTTVTSDEGKVVFKTEETRDSSDIQGKSGGYGYGARIPLKDLPPGLYVLKVDARSRLGSSPQADRQVQFQIR